jgi:hypothetical protein
MRTPLILRPLSLLLAGLVAVGSAMAQTVPVRVGPTDLALPVPAGYEEPSARVPRLRQLGETMTPAGNRLLAIFVATPDVDLAAAGRAPAMRRYFMAQTLRAGERDTLTAKGFDEVKGILRQQYKQLLAQVEPQIAQHMADASRKVGGEAGRPELKIRVGEILPLEVFDERAGSISLAALGKVTVDTEAVKREIPMAMALTTASVRGKVVYFYAYSVYDTADDLDWTRRVTRDWLEALK